MPDNRFDNKRVSDEWDIVLTAARRDHVKFFLTSGRRTMADQWRLYRAYKNGTGNLAAYPSPNAPHIRVGRINHAIDENSLDGGEARLQRWLEDRGVAPTNPVAGEAWHMELSAAQLRRLAAKLTGGGFTTLYKGVKDRQTGVKRLQRYLRVLGFKWVRINGRYDLATRVAVRRFQRKHGIPTDPRTTVGNRTWAALRAAVR